jgi:hypothetical protein
MLAFFFSFILCCTLFVGYLAQHFHVQILVLKKEEDGPCPTINKSIFFAMWLLDHNKYEFCSFSLIGLFCMLLVFRGL